jgi:eukaryotic-like serine/threonine-protein kinase
MSAAQRPGAAAATMTGPRRRLDRYELIAEIASGGMATVMLARLAGAGGFSRLFAIKLLHPHLANDPQFVDMLLDEARLAAQIHHANAVPIIDVCQSSLGLYLVMDYIEGFSFSRILGTPLLTQTERIRVGVQALLGVLAGLDAAHNLTDDRGAAIGLVHRDVSPQNVLIGIDGAGRIADFGIAHAGTRITQTQPGTVKGKIAYMAPEQATGGALDRRADVFSVGVMLWECLTAKRLFKAPNEAATLLKLLEDPIRPPSTIQPAAPVELDAICARALARPPEARYASAHEMASDLARAAEKAGCLASNMEAADLMRARMSQEISERRDAIQRYCSVLTGNGGAMRLGELASLPKLSLSGGRPPIAGRVDLLHEASKSLSGVDLSSPRLHDHETPAPPIAFEAEAEDSAEAAAFAPASNGTRVSSLPSSSQRAGRIVGAMLVALAVAFAVGLWWRHKTAVASVANSAPPAVGTGGVAAPAAAAKAAEPAANKLTERNGDLPSATLGNATPENPPPAASPQPAAGTTTTADGTATAAKAASHTPASDPARPSGAHAADRRRAHGAQPAATPSRARDGADDAPRGGSEPALELNPYLHR